MERERNKRKRERETASNEPSLLSLNATHVAVQSTECHTLIATLVNY